MRFLKKNWVLGLLFLLCTIWFSWNLGGQGYSLDENGTITVAKGIWRVGYPSAWDGTNFMSETNGYEYTYFNGLYLWTWHSPLQYYLVFLSTLLFGESVVTTRLPFVLIGSATVVLFYLLSRQVFRSKKVSYLLIAQLLLLAPFFLYIRQTRYYAPAAFFSLLTFWCTYQYLRGKKQKYLLPLTLLGSSLLFFTNHLMWSASIGVLIGALLWKKLYSQAVFIGVEVVLAVLFLILLHPYGGEVMKAYPSHENFLIPLVKYLAYTNAYLFPLIVAPVIFLLRKKEATFFFLALITIGCKLFVYSYLVDPHGRNLIDLYPIFVMLVGYVYSYLFQRKKIFLAFGMFSIVAFTNIFSFPLVLLGSGHHELIIYPEKLRYEMVGTYPTMFQQLGDYMKKDYKKGDLFWSNSYRSYLYVASGIPFFSPVCHNAKSEGPPQVLDQEKIKWVILYQYDDRLLRSPVDDPCLGKKWEKVLQEQFTKKIFPFQKGTPIVNDPDIVNRFFPPHMVNPDQVIFYERKGIQL